MSVLSYMIVGNFANKSPTISKFIKTYQTKLPISIKVGSFPDSGNLIYNNIESLITYNIPKSNGIILNPNNTVNVECMQKINPKKEIDRYMQPILTPDTQNGLSDFMTNINKTNNTYFKIKCSKQKINYDFSMDTNMFSYKKHILYKTGIENIVSHDLDKKNGVAICTSNRFINKVHYPKTRIPLKGPVKSGSIWYNYNKKGFKC